MGIIGILVAIILILGGIAYTIVPHEVHVAYGIDFGFDHITNTIMGIVIVVLGFVIYWTAGKKKKAKALQVPKIGK